MADTGERGSDEAKPPEKGDRMKAAKGQKRRSSHSIGQRLMALKELRRERQNADALALEKQTKAAQRKAARQLKAEERKVLASAKEFDRKHGNWDRPRSKAVPVSEAQLLDLGGVKKVVLLNESRQTWIVFGGKGEAQLVFKPCNGGWKVSMEGKPSLEELRRELCKAGRGLWNPDEQKPGVAFQAAEALLSCWQNFRGLPADDQQKAETHFAITRTLEALKKRQGKKLEMALTLLSDERSERLRPHLIEKLQETSGVLAAELQRPPYKAELRDRSVPWADRPQFARLLRDSGLTWLRTKPRGLSRASI
jgi:hypothetical protein